MSSGRHFMPGQTQSIYVFISLLLWLKYASVFFSSYFCFFLHVIQILYFSTFYRLSFFNCAVFVFWAVVGFYPHIHLKFHLLRFTNGIFRFIYTFNVGKCAVSMFIILPRWLQSILEKMRIKQHEINCLFVFCALRFILHNVNVYAHCTRFWAAGNILKVNTNTNRAHSFISKYYIHFIIFIVFRTKMALLTVCILNFSYLPFIIIIWTETLFINNIVLCFL